MKRHLLFKSLLLLCALIVGTNAWAVDPTTIYYESFGSTSSTSAYGSYTGYSATTAMFTTTGNVNTHYSGDGTVGKNDLSAANLSSGYTGASGLSGCYQQGVKNTEKTIIQIANINIEGYENLSLSFGALGGSTEHKVNVSYIIDSGSETSLISNGSITNANWTLKSANISGTGKSLTLIFKHTPSKGWLIRLDDIKVTGTASGGSGGGSSDPSISLGSTTVNATEAAVSTTTINVTYNNLTNYDADVIFYESDGTTYASYDHSWLTAEINASTKNLDYSITANTGAARTAYLKVYALGDEGDAESSLITVTQAAKTVAKPTFGLDGGNYWEGTTFTLTSAGNTIYYTTDGSTPSNTSTEYTSPVAIAAGKVTYKAIAYDAYGNTSSVAQCTYTGVASATLPFSWDEKATSTTGVINSGVGNYNSSPYLKFDDTDDNLTLKFEGVPGTLTFDILGNGFSGGTFKVQTSADGETYIDLKTYTELGSKQTETFILANNVRYIKWVYTNKDNGNVALGKINLTSTITLTPAKTYTTLTSAKDLDFTSVSSDLKAYIATEIAGDKVQMIQVNKVPANTGLVLKATTPGSAVNVPVFDGTSADAVSANKMAGSATATTAIAENGGYILKDGVFQPATAGTLAAGKAYLAIAVSGARALEMNFDDDVTAIEAVKAQNVENGQYFNLAGQRVANPTKGLYIVNGRKVVMK